MRVVSLLPAATEIMGALGLMDSVVGVSHECDYPSEANQKPRVTRCPIHGAGLSSEEVDRWVRERLAAGEPLYTLDEALLHALRPDVILTQRLCDVCAVDYGSVAALACKLPGSPRVVNLEPSCVADIFENIRTVGAELEVMARADEVVKALQARVRAVQEKARNATPRPRCFLMEWIDPPFCSGHWAPELVELAGGVDPLGRRGEDSTRVTWEAIVAAQPEVLVLACCGYKPERTLQDVPILRRQPGWDDLPAVRDRRVWVVDGSAYFSRPGPRIVDSLEILAAILHPDLFSYPLAERSVMRVDTAPGEPAGTRGNTD